MKLSFNKICLLSGLMLSLLMVTTIHAEMGMGKEKMFGDEKGWEEKINKMYDKLNLSEEQRAQLKAQKESHRAEMTGVRQQIQAKRQEFQEEIQKKEFDAGKLKAINNDLKSLFNQIADYRLESLIKVRGILTPEQFAKFIELKEEHKGEWKDKIRDKVKEKRQDHREIPKL